MLRTGFLFLAMTAALFGQFDPAGFATGLYGKFGPPLNRQTFEARVGIEMIVDYAANGHVCRIQLPAIAPEQDQPNTISRKGLQDFLAELLPVSLRGKELRRMSAAMGAISMSSIEYENVTISEILERPGTVTVSFKGESCGTAF